MRLDSLVPLCSTVSRDTMASKAAPRFVQRLLAASAEEAVRLTTAQKLPSGRWSGARYGGRLLARAKKTAAIAGIEHNLPQVSGDLGRCEEMGEQREGKRSEGRTGAREREREIWCSNEGERERDGG